ncbi:hypothetical protein HRUBRA_00849 [Pseudohaliea rubra DSM 19751]|uniref:Uncharacterized protein n=1 Tax=Pseudohaliea rubra DSM 19751 TaxID=1265313 RepID=A0A095VT21_9GAMM|nr:hypothetical protein HRUBRA_00849 [Pseudohaliea rubra DSM 19751]
MLTETYAFAIPHSAEWHRPGNPETKSVKGINEGFKLAGDNAYVVH